MVLKQHIEMVFALTTFAFASFTGGETIRDLSTAGFFTAEDGARSVFNFNVGWRFHKGSVEGAEAVAFNDSDWSVVNAPHGLEVLPDNASGSVNYQGEAWYRKHFTLPASMNNQRVVLYFEAIMGKSKVWLNGELVKEQFGGFLPIVIDVTDVIQTGKENVVAVLADNSNDPDFPPGKPQEAMDFTYFGGIYRDVWLYSTASIYITDPNSADTVAGGGVFVHYENLTDDSVDVVVSTQIENSSDTEQAVEVSSTVLDADGVPVGEITEQVMVGPGMKMSAGSTITIRNPHLWHPDDPYLHKLVSKVRVNKHCVDALTTRIGIRKIEFRGKEGFFLNNQPFGDKLMGANRHQDFAYIGNAMPNSLHWRDAKKLRNAGMRIIRSAHYPQDPAFMDACDELGLFVIVATPGWQFWNDEPVFEQHVYSDIRQMVRRDRNHPSVILWEPILNETHYPESFAKTARDIVHEEYPVQGCYTAADERAKGSRYYEVLYSGTRFSGDKAVFIREWGDNVDDWSSHNSPSRAHRSWGEAVQLVQAKCYADPRPMYSYGCWESFYHDTSPQLVGGCLWHSFDHYRGYHPDNFFGGIMGPFRQPKYSYYLFQSQRDPKLSVPQIDNGPMVYIANEMTPFSSQDVRVFTNCEEVRLSAFGKVVGTLKVGDLTDSQMPSPPLEFKDVYNFMELRALHRDKKFNEACIMAEGLIGGSVVATAKRWPSKRKHRLELSVDFDGTSLVADGSDIVVVIASLVDEQGNVKRLGLEDVFFEVSGEGELIGSNMNGANPRKLEWGTAPCLVRSSLKSGTITIRARSLLEGINTPLAGEVTIRSVSPPNRLLFGEVGTPVEKDAGSAIERKRSARKVDLDSVGILQSEFEHQ